MVDRIASPNAVLQISDCKLINVAKRSAKLFSYYYMRVRGNLTQGLTIVDKPMLDLLQLNFYNIELYNA